MRQPTTGQTLPPVLPFVLDNGKLRWTAATDISQLIEPAPGQLADYTPRLKYLLLDEGALDESGPWALKNLAAALFRLEKTPDPAGLERAVGVLIEWLKDSEQASLRHAFTVWIKRVLIPGRLPGIALPELGNLMEIKTMLAESVIEWTEQWKQQGLEQGLEQGLRQGEVTLLKHLLIKRFGVLTEATESSLSNATLEQIEFWAGRVLDAKTLDDVFGVH